jgi:rhodanese-related sulfurtransferase/DNA-binding transcriptional ArsR family regulator
MSQRVRVTPARPSEPARPTASTARATKTALNEQFARIGKSLASPRRIELLDLLAQGEHTVEQLAAETDMSVTLTSAHLQALRQGRLVETRRDGRRIFYRLAGDDVVDLLAALRAVAHARLAEVEKVVNAFFGLGDELEPIGRAELVRRAQKGDVILLDLRPREEYRSGHIPGAVSVPLGELPRRLAELPRDAEIVAYCRGPYCVMAPRGIALLRRHGYRVRRLEDGVAEWRLAGLPVAAGLEPGTPGRSGR